MLDIQTDLSTPALIKAFKANCYAFFRFLCDAPITDFWEGAGMMRWHAPVPAPLFHGVLCQEAPAANVGELISQMLAYFKAHQQSAISWWLNTDVQVNEWKNHLLEYGFVYEEGGPGMAIDLNCLPADVSMPRDFEIVVVGEREQLQSWVSTVLAGFGLPRDDEEGVLQLMIELGLDYPLRNYLGILRGQPVATSHVFFGASVAGLMGVTTLPEARGQGIGTAMTLAPLLDAREEGYRIGVLQSSKMGFNVYRRLGFKTVC